MKMVSTIFVLNTISFPYSTWKFPYIVKRRTNVATMILLIKSNRKCEQIIFKLKLQKCFLIYLKYQSQIAKTNNI